MRSLWFLFCLNLLDGISTDIALRHGIAGEANPFMHRIWALGGPIGFWLVKGALMTALTSFLSIFRKRLGVRVATELLNVSYLIVLCIHLIGWGHYFNSLYPR